MIMLARASFASRVAGLAVFSASGLLYHAYLGARISARSLAAELFSTSRSAASRKSNVPASDDNHQSRAAATVAISGSSPQQKFHRRSMLRHTIGRPVAPLAAQPVGALCSLMTHLPLPIALIRPLRAQRAVWYAHLLDQAF